MTQAKSSKQRPLNALRGMIGQLYMLDEERGWLSCWYNEGDTVRDTIMRTTDGGRSWQPSLACTPYQKKGAEGPSLCLTDFYSPEIATVLEPLPENRSRIHHTSDGGQSWQRSTVAARHLTAPPLFLDERHGWFLGSDHFADPEALVGQEIALYHTADAGRSWQRMLGGSAAAKNGSYGEAPLTADTRMVFTDPATGWFAGQAPTKRGPNPWLYVTRDTGDSWQQVTLAFPPGITPVFIWPPRFFTPQDGLLQVWIMTRRLLRRPVYSTHFYVTHDGGESWQPCASAPFDISDGQFLDLQRGWAISSDPARNGALTLYMTSDGGQTWERRAMRSDFTRVFPTCFVSLDVGWALGMNLERILPGPSLGLQPGESIAILKTSDGGESWQEIARSTL